MTQLDVVYRYGVPPTEAAMLAMSKVRDVYGVRALVLSEAEKYSRFRPFFMGLLAPTGRGRAVIFLISETVWGTL